MHHADASVRRVEQRAVQREAHATRLLAVAIVLMTAGFIARPFLPGILWATLLAYWTWAVRRELVRHMRPTLAALLLTTGVIAVVALTTLWVARVTRDELAQLSEVTSSINAILAYTHRWISSLPLVGGSLGKLVPQSIAGVELEAILRAGSDVLRGFVAAVLARAGSGIFHIMIAVATLFFLYRDGGRWLAIARELVISWYGNDGRQALDTIVDTLAVVTRGVLIAAVCQGAIAGVGYWVAGLPNTVALAILTAVLALVPFGAVLVWLPAAGWLAAQGDTLAALGVLAWGVLVVSSVDNILRPALMHARATLSFWPLTLSLIGGALAFGLPGVYLGPVAFSLIALWLRPRPVHPNSVEHTSTESTSATQ